MRNLYTPDDIRLNPTQFLFYKGLIRKFYDANKLPLLEAIWDSRDEIASYVTEEERCLT